MKWANNNALYLAWLVTLAGCLLCLFIGELLKIEPCHLCWWQRVFLFPLVIQLGMAAYKNDLGIIPYVYPLVALGALFALYQVIGQHFPFLFSNATCGYNDECSNPIFTLFEFLTLPFLSLIGFLLIGFFLWIAKRHT